MADHVHMLVLIPPKISVSSFMGYLKEKSALMMFDKHVNFKYKYEIDISGVEDIMWIRQDDIKERKRVYSQSTTRRYSTRYIKL